MNDRVSQHERMRRYLQHRERVLEVKSVVKTGLVRSQSTGSNAARAANFDFRKGEEQRKIDAENRRLLQSLVKISAKPGQYSAAKSRPASAHPRRQSAKR